MRWVIILLALAGIIAASLALREHYRTEASPCSINEKWDCGTVNKSPYAVIGGLMKPPGPDTGDKKGLFAAIGNIPVAVVGIAGYLLLALMAFKRWLPALAGASIAAFLFSLYLAHIEKDVLGVWCIYCVISLGIISLIMLLSVITAVTTAIKKPA